MPEVLNANSFVFCFFVFCMFKWSYEMSSTFCSQMTAKQNTTCTKRQKDSHVKFFMWTIGVRKSHVTSQPKKCLTKRVTLLLLFMFSYSACIMFTFLHTVRPVYFMVHSHKYHKSNYYYLKVTMTPKFLFFNGLLQGSTNSKPQPANHPVNSLWAKSS